MKALTVENITNMQGQTVTLVVAVAGIFGTLGSGIVAQRMARKSARQQWLIDSRKEEFRELITTLTQSFLTISARLRPMVPIDGPEQRELETARWNSFRVIHDRLYIKADVKRLDILGLWTPALLLHERHLNVEEFANRFEKMSNSIVEAAVKEH
jgi:hypothetical protein